jgi:hypothetical protein
MKEAVYIVEHLGDTITFDVLRDGECLATRDTKTEAILWAYENNYVIIDPP